jgi:hypothetical protein
MSSPPVDGELFYYRTPNGRVMSKKAVFLVAVAALALVYFVKK